ncbi:hypothetical protein BOTBODRAFT_254212 [Botryobasidium botryosum FD-172 SS1]|uniref:Uncharacterized protein n=1 Tax=Botryobasidium botryosum (strain FD-172 SS1) TaxID=930990 RepID=A0A067M493_BOTB1|nr:hypothetical protein BOTBODRAFT_254212 [Botryobasidium botryosum FD-172 SS1]
MPIMQLGSCSYRCSTRYIRSASSPSLRSIHSSLHPWSSCSLAGLLQGSKPGAYETDDIFDHPVEARSRPHTPALIWPIRRICAFSLTAWSLTTTGHQGSKGSSRSGIMQVFSKGC